MGGYVNGEDLLAVSTVGDVNLRYKEYFTQNFYFLLKLVIAVSSIIFSINRFFLDTMFSWA